MLISFLLIISLAINTEANGFYSDTNCWFNDGKGNDYDLSPLKREAGWKAKDIAGDSGLFSMVYLFNFCKPVPLKCKNMEAAAFEALEVLGQVTDTCEILGKNTVGQTEIEPLDQTNPDKGLRITYNGGDMCSNKDIPSESSKPRRVHFVVECAEESDQNFDISYKVNPYTQVRGSGEGTKCNLEFRIKSPGGCRTTFLSTKTGRTSLSILLWIFLIAILYFGGGFYYNFKQKGLRGQEAIPHIRVIKEFPSLVAEGVKFTLSLSQDLVSKLKERGKGSGAFGGRSSGYFTV